MEHRPRIIAAKVRRPSPEGLDRPRLSLRLGRGPGSGIVVVIAPPGSGKTTLLAQAAAALTATAWCTVGPEDRSGVSFLHHVARSLSLALGEDLEGPDSTAALLEALDPPETGLLLVIDDAHELAGGEAEHHLSELLRWRPGGLRIALGTRRPVATDTARLLVAGELVELTADDLRFRSWEVEELFRRVYEQPLSPEAAAALTRRTGGWAAGLKLFQLATAGKSAHERERAVADLSGRSRLLRSYLTRTVLAELDPETRRFLLLSSTLGTLTGPLCDALLDRSGSAVVLEELAARQFFTVAAEDGASYRYHPVLQTLLEGLLQDEVSVARAAKTYAVSAGLLEKHGLLGDAARAYVLAGDYASVRRLVQCTDGSLVVGALDGASGLADDPWLMLARARRLHRSGSIVEAVATYRRAETLLDDAELRRRASEERSRAASWLPDAVAVPPRPREHPEPSTEELVRQATVRVTTGDPRGGPLARALQLLLRGDVEQARIRLRTMVALTAAERVVADLTAVVADLLSGDAGAVVTRLEEVTLAADLQDQPWLARVARGLQAASLLALGGEPWWAESCGSLAEDSHREGDRWGALVLESALGVALVLRGDDRGEQRLARAGTLATQLRAEAMAVWVEMFAAAAVATTDHARGADRLARARAHARSCGLHRAEAVVAQALAPLRPPVAGGAPPAPGARWRLLCLGGFLVERDGKEARLPDLRPLPRTLLLLLAMHHGEHLHRELIITWLWPDTAVAAASHRLHAAASSVRRALADAGLSAAVVQRHGETYRLLLAEEAADVAFDVAELDRALRDASQSELAGDVQSGLRHCRRALELYRGDLLPEAGPAEWVVGERERLRVATAAAAYTWAATAFQWGMLEEALAAGRRATELDPLRDSAWDLLAEVQTRMGDVTAAAATRRTHGEVFLELCGGSDPRRLPRQALEGQRRSPWATG